MFVDQLKISAKAGNGGDGVVRWLRLKYQPKSGPAGGNGGKGGDVYVRGVRDVNQLAKYTGTKEFRARNGESGRSRSQAGKGSNDLTIDIPVGSIVTNTETGRSFEVTKEGETVLLLRGGHGGLGNEVFKSSTNRSPEESTPGKPGESGTFLIEVRLTADVGLVGLPNAGKSTLLNALTNAKSQVGSYPFTTLEPHLGELFGFIIADIPGLIEGAAEGKGLGHKFLRHVAKTNMLLHLVSLESADPEADFHIVNSEIMAYSKDLLDKPRWIILTKSDVVSDDTVRSVEQSLAKNENRVFIISQNDPGSVKSLKDELVKYLRSKSLTD